MVLGASIGTSVLETSIESAMLSKLSCVWWGRSVCVVVCGEREASRGQLWLMAEDLA